MDGLYRDRLSIIGLNYEPNDTAKNTEKAKEYADMHQLSWLQGIADKEITAKLSANGFPFYILVDKNKKICFLGNQLEEVEQILIKK